jgi:hypothetical protein
MCAPRMTWYTLVRYSTTLMRMWQEREYRIYVCRVTRGAHIEHL